MRRWSAASAAGGRAKELPQGTLVYEFSGPMFFAGADKILDFALDEGTRTLILRMGAVPSVDATAMKNLELVLSRCRENGTVLILSHVQELPLAVMKNSGFYDRLGAENFASDIDEALSKAARSVRK